jgi:hypothetical protein
MEDRSGDEREIRAARNQSMLRAINERLTHDDHVAEITGGHMIACECADSTCVQILAITTAQYQEVRREPRRFAVVPGHVYPDVEIVVAQYGPYVVVEKIGPAGEAAEKAQSAKPQMLP